jgi:hypothetical protein
MIIYKYGVILHIEICSKVKNVSYFINPQAKIKIILFCMGKLGNPLCVKSSVEVQL